MPTWVYALVLISAAFLQHETGAADTEKAAGSCQEPLYECPSCNISYLLHLPGKSERSPKEVTEDSVGSVRLHGMALKVLVHDFGGGPDDAFSKMLRNAYLSRGGTAVLTVDWSALAAQRCGRKFAEAQTELVGACTARLLAAGAAAGSMPPPERLHALGAGLGAHIAALAAACLPGGHIGRLTALDPTPAPVLRSFGDTGGEKLLSAPLLDIEAALQVDVLHTSGLAAGVPGVGDPRPAGHVDIYISCGLPVQPFCHRSSDPAKCSHELAAAYFAEGVWPGPGLRAGPCKDACRRNLSLPELPLSVAAKLSAATVPVGEDLPFTASGILCAEAYSRPPFGRQRGNAWADHEGGGYLCWMLSAASLLYLGARALFRRVAPQGGH